MRPLRPHSSWLAYVAAALVLAFVFQLYLQPGVIVDLANRIWSCL